MRLHLTLSRNSESIPYDHVPVLAGALHKWLGHNKWHNDISLYSFSWLSGGVSNKNGISFPNGARWFVSAYEASFIKSLISGIQRDPSINYGLEVRSITIEEDPTFISAHTFNLASPVLIKRTETGRVRHYFFTDKEADHLLGETLKTKLKKAGLSEEGIKVWFDRQYPFAKTKLVNYNGIGNKASICPVTIEGTQEQLAFAWNVGIGNSAGIGFGALK